MNNNDIVVFDFETGGIDPYSCQPIQIAALAINPRTLTPYENGSFAYMMRPEGEPSTWNLSPQALAVNKKTIPEIEAAPGEKQVWQNFYEFLKRFNRKNTKWDAPIPAGQNIKKFDLIIADRLFKKYGMSDSRDKVLNTMKEIDLIDITFMWFENSNELITSQGRSSYSLDTLRKYFGITTEGSHDALVDVQQTAEIIIRFLQFHRRIASTTKFAGAFAHKQEGICNEH